MAFINEFFEYLNEFESFMNVNTRLMLAEDENINLLQCDKQPHVASFRTTTYSHNLHPSNVYPSRTTSYSATLIDNLFFNESPAASSINYSNISDYLPIFIF